MIVFPACGGVRKGRRYEGVPPCHPNERHLNASRRLPRPVSERQTSHCDRSVVTIHRVRARFSHFPSINTTPVGAIFGCRSSDLLLLSRPERSESANIIIVVVVIFIVTVPSCAASSSSSSGSSSSSSIILFVTSSAHAHHAAHRPRLHQFKETPRQRPLATWIPLPSVPQRRFL